MATALPDTARDNAHRDDTFRDNARGQTIVRRLLIILGTPIDALNMPEAIDRIDDFVAAGRLTGKWHQVATVNADFVVNSLHDPHLRRILQNADLATADGMPLVWSARLLGVPMERRVTGVDMVAALAERAAQRGYRLYLLGAAPGVAEQAAAILTARYPRLRIVGIASPSKAAVAAGDPAIIAACKAAKPDILLVAFGNPKQEKWIAAHAAELGVPVMMGVGGTFDFIAGVTQRAPQWMQQSGFEWLHRLLKEPRRLWRRYAVDLGSFGYNFLRQWWLMRDKAPARAGSRQPPDHEPDRVTLTRHPPAAAVIKIYGRLDRSNQNAAAALAQFELADPALLIVDLSRTTFLDSSAIGTLVGLTKAARDQGGDLWLADVPPDILRILRLLKLDQFFQIYADYEAALAQRPTKASA